MPKIGPIVITNNTFTILLCLLKLCDVVIYLVHLNPWDKDDFRCVSSSEQALNKIDVQGAR